MTINYAHLDRLLNLELKAYCGQLDLSVPPHRVTIGFTGGREDEDLYLFNFVMGRVAGTFPIGKVIHGDARGYDTLGKLWGMRTGKTIQTLPARWKSLGNAAGPVRNDLMIEALRKEPLPLVLGFPGGSGTADMLMKTEMAGIYYIAISDMLP